MDVAILGSGYLGDTVIDTGLNQRYLEEQAKAQARGESPFYQEMLMELVRQGGAGWRSYIESRFNRANTQSEKEDVRKLQQQIESGDLDVSGGGGLPGGNTAWIIGGSAAAVLLIILATRTKRRRRR